MLVLKNLDHLFQLQTDFAAADNYNSPFSSRKAVKSTFNSGFMLLTPSMYTFERMVKSFGSIPSYNGGDQGFLNSFFRHWTRLNSTYNVNKMRIKYSAKDFPPLEEVYALHYVRQKPWYDIRDQWEYFPSRQLLDKPRDYAQLDDIWRRVYAKTHLELGLYSRHAPVERCIDLYGTQNQSCYDVYERFCPGELYGCGLNTPSVLEPQWDVSLTVQLSEDRLERFLDLLAFWTGPVSAALYSTSSWPTLNARLLMLPIPWSRLELSLVFPSKKSSSEPYYPINLLRTIALEQARTDMVLVVDVDFVPTLNLYTDMIARSRWTPVWNLTLYKHAFVIPAFEFSTEPRCYSFSNCSYIETDELKHMLRDGRVQPFHPHGKGHRATNTPRWLNASVGEYYYIQWEEWYEPYLLFRRSAIDFTAYDPRFVDRGRNKMLLPLHLHARGWSLAVVPDSFLIHQWEKEEEVAMSRRLGMRFRHEVYHEVVQGLMSEFHCTADGVVCASERGPMSNLIQEYREPR